MCIYVCTSRCGRQATGLLVLADFLTDLLFFRYGGRTYAGQCIWQKNLAQGAMVLAPVSDWADVDFPAASFGRGKASDYGFG